ncbi:MAG TPA: ABC transporter permease [Ohtaekwangia sp.]|nr:ABC transporter permease [Ohtaekwangia sp.]
MLRHNFLLIYRNIKRFKTTFFINLIGLSTGLACTLLIYLWVNDELQMDKFHERDSSLYQIMENQNHGTGTRATNSTPWLLAEALKEEMPEVEYASVVTPSQWFKGQTLSVGLKNTQATGTYTGKDFFHIFSYELLQGSKDNVLSDRSSIVISEKVAMNLFQSTENVVGKTIELQHEKQYQVSGVFRNVPSNSTMQFDFVLSVDVLKQTQPEAFAWENAGPKTFVVLKEGTDSEGFNTKISNFISTKSKDTHRNLFLTSYSDNYLHYAIQYNITDGGRIVYVRLFSIIAIFILLIACINFMNLSTAKASRRIKEIGIKKAVGANRIAIILQYLVESIVITSLSLLVAIFITDLVLPQFNIITNKHLTLHLNTHVVGYCLIITLITGVIAGSYPALYLSGFKPAVVLKGQLESHSSGELWARKGLVVFQFALSVIFIVSVMVIYKQIEFVQTKNLGYNNDNVIYFSREGKIKESTETFLSEVKKIPGIINASSISQSLVGGGNTTDIEWEGKDPESIIPFAIRPVNYDVIEMLDLEIIAGRAFSKDHADSMKVIFNEAGIEAMGLADPIGKKITLGPFNCEIAGVIKNFHYESLHVDVKPLFFILAPEYAEKIMVKIEARKTAETLAQLKHFYQQYNPGFIFEYRFLDEDNAMQYAAEQRVATLSKYFSGLAILISCLGLFGLAAFTVERRLKEIGIRKALGASEFGIVYLLSGDFTKMVLTAIVIALPISYLLVKQWLEGFAFKIELEWWYFISSGIIALLIAWITVGLQTIKAARVNPADCLKDE